MTENTKQTDLRPILQALLGQYDGTICDNCEQKWADDEGGFVPYEDAPAVVAARAALTHTAASVASGGDAAVIAAARAVIDDFGSSNNGPLQQLYQALLAHDAAQLQPRTPAEPGSIEFQEVLSLVRHHCDPDAFQEIRTAITAITAQPRTLDAAVSDADVQVALLAGNPKMLVVTKEFRESMRRALEAFAAGRAVAQPAPVQIPEGWKLVPIEATPAMYVDGGQRLMERIQEIQATGRSIHSSDEALARTVYAAMLSAAPTPHRQIAHKRTLEQSDDHLSMAIGLVQGFKKRHGGYQDGSPIDTFVAEVSEYLIDWPVTPPVSQAEPTDSRITGHKSAFTKDEHGLTIPTVTVTFQPDDWDARDAFAKSLLYSPTKDADSRDALLLRSTLADVVSVAITMLFDSHKDDVTREFSVAELTAVSKLSEGLGGAQVEAIYRKGFDLAAIQAKGLT